MPWNLGKPSPVLFQHRGLRQDRLLTDRLLDDQEDAGFFVRNLVLADGRRARMVVHGNVRRLEVWAPGETQAPGETPLPEVVLLWMEHGWRALDSGGDGTVYLHASLAAYYAGMGTTLPDSLGTDHLVGLLATAPEEYAPTWPDDPPVVGDDDEHASLICTESAPCAPAEWETRRPAHEYSGLTRAWVQALHGAGRRVADVLPAAWDSPSLGIQRGPDGTYWAFAAGSSLVARRLEHRPELAVLAGWCEDGDLTGESRLLGDAYVLGWLRQPVDEEGQTDPDEIDLGSLADAYDLGDGLSGSGIAGRGWAWRQQVRGASDEHTAGAVLCPITSVGENADWRLWSARSVLTIQWDSETARPTGVTITQTAPVEWVPDGGTLWATYVESGGQAAVCLDAGMRRPAACTHREAVTAHWAAWYADDGSRVDCSIETSGPAATGNSGLSIDQQAAIGVGLCPGSQQTLTYTAWSAVRSEVVSIGPVSSAAQIAGTWRSDWVAYKAGPAVWTDTGLSGLLPGTYGHPNCATVTVPDGTIPTAQQIATATPAYREVTAGYLTVSGIGGGRIIILPPDPQCAWMAQSVTWTGRSYSGSWSDYGPAPVVGGRVRAYPSLSPMGEYMYRVGFPPGGTPVASETRPDDGDTLPPTRLWYVGADGSAVQIEDDQAEAWATALGALGLSLPCTDSIAAGVMQSAGGRVLATGVDDGGLSAAGMLTAGRWVGGV